MVNLTEHARGKLDGVPTSIVATPGMCGLCNLFLQISPKDDNPAKITDYGNTTLYECEAIHDNTYEAHLAVSMILSPYHSIYGKLIGYPLESYS